VLEQPLGVVGLDAAVSAMGSMHYYADNARHISLLTVSGEYDTSKVRLRVVRENLFGPGLGFGNKWTQTLKSRAALIKLLNDFPQPSPVEARVLVSLRGLLGQVCEIPVVGMLAEPESRRQ
jgi:hypothetical protein